MPSQDEIERQLIIDEIHRDLNEKIYNFLGDPKNNWNDVGAFIKQCTSLIPDNINSIDDLIIGDLKPSDNNCGCHTCDGSCNVDDK